MATKNLTTTETAAELQKLSDHIYRSLEAICSMFSVLSDLTARDAEQHSKEIQRLAFLGESVAESLTFDVDMLATDTQLTLGTHYTQKAQPDSTGDNFVVGMSRLSSDLSETDKRYLLNFATVLGLGEEA